MNTKPALITGQGEIVKKDGTVIPITLKATTEHSIEELRAMGLNIEDVTEETNDDQSFDGST